MFKTYEKYLIKNFLNKFLVISFFFFKFNNYLKYIRRNNFFKNIEISFLYPYFLTF